MSHLHNFPGPDDCPTCRQERHFVDMDWQTVLNGKLSTDEYVDRHFEKLYEKHVKDMPYGTAKASDGDPTEWLYEHYDNEFMEIRVSERYMEDTA